MGVLSTLLAVLAGGMALQAMAPLHESTEVTPVNNGPAAHRSAPPLQTGHAVAPRDEVRERFEQAVLMLHARQFEHAATSLHRVLELAPQMPEAHVNMGFAMLGLQRAGAARDFFEGATILKPDQTNAYYGLALANEVLGDAELAIGAMRSYLHLARDESDAHLRRARAALWEWEAQRQAAQSPPTGAMPPAAPLEKGNKAREVGREVAREMAREVTRGASPGATPAPTPRTTTSAPPRPSPSN